MKVLESLVGKIDLTSPISEEYPDPIVHLVVVALTHNSYHLGQIMVIKKALER